MTEEGKEQRRAAKREWNQKNRLKIAERKRRAYAEDPTRFRAANRKSVYGISSEEYQRRLLEQKGVCAICQNSCRLGRQLAVDHNHQTGRVRGLLCSRCNFMLGQAEDDAVRLLAAARYLEVNS